MSREPTNWRRVRSYCDRYLALVCLLSTIGALAGLEKGEGLFLRFGLVATLTFLVAYDKLFVAGFPLVIVSFRSLFVFALKWDPRLLLTGTVTGGLFVFLLLRYGNRYAGRREGEIWFWYTEKHKSAQILLDIIVVVILAFALRALRYR